ncbi:MAG TPA: hypothetical protein VFO89_15640 [Thermoanaerobaculia bacterium]|nr:hypothetical protein [Thermoanaerobaculia bacterium]
MESSEYAFHAAALGLGGVIERGRTTTVIPSLGSVVLPSCGGEGSAEVRNYDRDGISFSTLQTRVGGYRVARHLFSTYSDILITNLNILDRVRVGLMQLTLTSLRQTDIDQPESRFEVRASYRGVHIDDEEVIPQIDVEMCSFETYAQFLRAAQEQPDRIAKKLEQSAEAVAELTRSRVPVVRGSIVSDIAKQKAASKLVHNKNKVVVPGLGRVQFGELLLKHDQRRVNLLRIDLGRFSPMSEGVTTFAAPVLEDPSASTGGTLVMAAGEGNGTPVWPSPGP